jgi:hypothetical protein
VTSFALDIVPSFITVEIVRAPWRGVVRGPRAT